METEITRIKITVDDEGVQYLEFYADDVRHGFPIKRILQAALIGSRWGLAETDPLVRAMMIYLLSSTD